MKSCAVVATHHKTGTVWMRSIFHGIANELDIPFANMKKRDVKAPSNIDIPSILFNDHSHFINAPWMLSHSQCRLLHIIRDPRDVLISAMNYHRTARERWLQKAQHEFQGKTYQEKLNSLPDDHARYLFEMENSTMRIITDMQVWKYDMPGCFECKYEDLIADVNMELFSKVFRHFGFEEDELEICRKEVWKNSLFGEREGKKNKHIRSGERGQWAKTFNRKLAEVFVEKFGPALIKLGYEPDNAWVVQLPD